MQLIAGVRVQSDFRRASQRGVSLIEVLVAVLVLSIGLLGIAMLQTSALSNNTMSYQYSLATTYAQDMVERIMSNRQGALAKNYTLGTKSSPVSSFSATINTDCSSATCSSADQATWDMAVWYEQVIGDASLSNTPTPPGTPLPGAKVSIDASDCTNTGSTPACLGKTIVITVYWDPNRTADSTNSSYASCNPAVAAALRCIQLVVTP